MISDDRQSLQEVHASVDTESRKGRFRRLLAFMGPAYLVSVGYMDPGNWATDIAAGSAFGYRLIWVLLMSNLMALLLQSLSARLGLVRKLDLAQASRAHYPKAVNYVLYGLAELAIAATDLAEILGMAIGLQLLTGLPLLWGVALTVFDTLLFLVLQRWGMRKMEAFIIVLISIIGGAFVVEMFLARPDAGEIARGFIPGLPDSAALYLAIGIIGATVMPHNLYLHSALVQTRRFQEGPGALRRAIRFNLLDSTVALNLAFFVNAAILILAAAAFHRNGLYTVVEIQDAHRLLSNLLGTQLAPTLFAVALIAAGQSSTITGTLAGQIVMEGYLHLRIQPWLRRLLTRLLAVVPAFLVIYYFGEEETGPMLIFSQVLLSLQLGFAVIPLIHFVSDRGTMGDFAIRLPLRVAAWLVALVIVALNVQLVIGEVSGWLAAAGPRAWMLWVTVVPVLLAFGGLLVYLLLRPGAGPVAGRSLHGEVADPALVPRVDYRRIAVAVDYSAVDARGLSEAIAVGGRGAEYVLIHVVESPGARLFGQETRDRETLNDQRQLDRYVDHLASLGYRARGVLLHGRPARQIAAATTREEAELLVLGAHGHGWWKDLLFGTTVDAVRHRVGVPVLIVR